MSIESDRNLVEAVLRGDRNAFAVLVQRYKGVVVAIATEILDDKHAAEDVAQDAFLTAYEGLSSLRDGGAFGFWLMQITRRAALRFADQHRRERVLHVDAGEPFADRNGKPNDRSMELLRLVQRLPEHERFVVMLRYFENHSVLEISDMIGHPVSTVTKRLTRARRRLGKWFRESEQ